jgi:Rad3-related DNA helicase
MFVKRWKQTGAFDGIFKSKEVFMEQRGVKEFEKEMKRYTETVESGRGALFIAVHRGKLSEGIDFSDSLVCALVYYRRQGQYWSRVSHSQVLRIKK